MTHPLRNLLSLEYGGKAYHFLSEQTRQEFEKSPSAYTTT
jgi:YHS domain-containing protein